jgi:chorismate mutase
MEKDMSFLYLFTRQKTDEIFLPIINETISLLKKVMENNNLSGKDINQIVISRRQHICATGKRTI